MRPRSDPVKNAFRQALRQSSNGAPLVGTGDPQQFGAPVSQMDQGLSSGIGRNSREQLLE